MGHVNGGLATPRFVKLVKPGALGVCLGGGGKAVAKGKKNPVYIQAFVPTGKFADSCQRA